MNGREREKCNAAQSRIKCLPTTLPLPLCNIAKQKLRVEIVEIISLSGVLTAGAIDVTRGQCRFRKRVSRLCKYSPKESE